MQEPLAISTALLLGLLGGSHCIGMCGGIAATIGMGSTNTPKRLLMLLSYNAGRIFSYALAGAIVGSISWLARDSQLMIGLRTAAGLMLVLMGLYVAQWWQGLTHIEHIGGRLWRLIQPLASRFLPAQNNLQALMLGSLWGWLPCGLVYSTLIWASAAGDWHLSATLMACFGIGTLPALLITGLLAQQFKDILQNKLTKGLFGSLIIIFGLYTIPWLGLVSS